MMITDPNLALRWAVEHFKILNESEALRRITNLDIVMNTMVIDGEEYAVPANCQVNLMAD